MNLSRFPIVQMQIDNDGSISDDIGDEDELDDDEEKPLDQSVNEDEEERHIHSNPSQQDSNGVTTSNSVVRKTKPIEHIQDEFLSDDDDDQSIIVQPDTRALTLISLLERTFYLLNRCRQLVSDIRNIGVVEAYVSMEIGEGNRGMALDMKVNFCFYF